MGEAATATRLQAHVAALAPLYPQAPALSDPLALILWENIGYLIDDDRRSALFAEFVERVGVSAQAIDRADGTTLLDIARRGGMRPDERVDRWRGIARLVLDRADGDLAATLARLPASKAKTLLKAFPMIGGPGADKVLLFAGLSLAPSLDSNGLRTLTRLGLIADSENYAALYRDGVGLMRREGVAERDWLVAAFGVLRDHGRTLCRRGAPQCLACPLDSDCAHAPVRGP
jgi:endonuclease III